MRTKRQESTVSPLGTQTVAQIHPDTHLGVVTLSVADLNRSIRFYQDVIGLLVIVQDAMSATLGAAGKPLIVLHERPGASPAPQRATGLYHVAILLPTQADLGRALQRLIAAGVPVGQGDHLVSEALYLSDPDGNGIEIYRDRPRSTWRWQNGQVQMATDPVDLEGLLAAAQREGTADVGAPAQTTIGHVHLKVADIEGARAFFVEALGFNVVADWPGALFVSAGGYHHHFGLNTWQSRSAAPAPQGSAGLVSYTIILPNAEALAHVVDRLAANSIAYAHDGGQVVLQDPWRNQVVLTVEPQTASS